MARARGPTEKRRERFRPYRPDTERSQRDDFAARGFGRREPPSTRPMILEEGWAERIQALFHSIGQECPANLTREDLMKAFRTRPTPSYYAEKYGHASSKTQVPIKLKDKQLPTKFKATTTTDDAMKHKATTSTDDAMKHKATTSTDDATPSD
ncbi:unnamed protein product [Arabis nemorensis]|uniref:Uncharacterized protein n=1 Tax=Arabis nemorensis TaxID=586526 RepID=A0A565CH30_9BRAS|nr:unnamed protein product [Arabis nemorensis]